MTILSKLQRERKKTKMKRIICCQVKLIKQSQTEYSQWMKALSSIEIKIVIFMKARGYCFFYYLKFRTFPLSCYSFIISVSSIHCTLYFLESNTKNVIHLIIASISPFSHHQEKVRHLIQNVRHLIHYWKVWFFSFLFFRENWLFEYLWELKNFLFLCKAIKDSLFANSKTNKNILSHFANIWNISFTWISVPTFVIQLVANNI